MSGNVVIFPTPYPDEMFYSVICRYDLLRGRNSFRGTCEELFGHRNNLTTEVQSRIRTLVGKIPKSSGMTMDYFIRNTTMFPYFKPFISKEREAVFKEYMASNDDKKTEYFSLGIGKLRYQRNTYLRLCEDCWIEDNEKYGEPYWHRQHQLPGNFVCHKHKKILMNSPVYIGEASKDLIPADIDMMPKSSVCANLSTQAINLFSEYSKNLEWIFSNYDKLKNSDDLYRRYDLWFRKKGFRSYSGKVWHEKLYHEISEYYGIEFLNCIGAYHEIKHPWLDRIIFFSDKLTHPLFHMLLICFLAGGAENFFMTECEETLPYGKGPWPCRNKICKYHLQDVIENIDIKYDKSFCRAVFECPHCGYTYRRKNPIPKEKQYSGTVYISDYGWLWKKTLIECLTKKNMSPRETCRLLGCDFYTVNKYAIELGLWNYGDLTTFEKIPKPKDVPCVKEEQPILTCKDYRKKWKDLSKQYPNRNRTFLNEADTKTSLWLQKNDRKWYEENTPKATYESTNWKVKDSECFEKVKNAVSVLKAKKGRPKQITIQSVIKLTGINALSRKDAKEKIPITMSYLLKNIDSAQDWRRKKIQWAVNEIYREGGVLSVAQILLKSAISREYFEPLKDYAQECINELLKK